ncbi:MAG: hypothetical protein NZ898_17100 [Myxococcota bacterium]|nr:hypothetical protein [Myxococcota bacterium]MDW8361794.1 hypothetical protein [Myxococcales bacterium]
MRSIRARSCLGLGLGLVVLTAVAEVPRVRACSCVARTDEQYFQDADAVFEGHVLRLERRPDVLLVHLRVVRAWKGIDVEQVVVRTAPAGSICGLEVEPGRSYLVYADGAPGSLSASLCGGTRPIEHAGDALRQLGEGVVPVDPVAEDRAPPLVGEDRNASSGTSVASASSSSPSEPSTRTAPTRDTSSSPAQAVPSAAPPHGGSCATCTLGTRFAVGVVGPMVWLIPVVVLGRARRRQDRR